MPDACKAQLGLYSDSFNCSADVVEDRFRADPMPPAAHRGACSPEPTTSRGVADFDARASPREGPGARMAAVKARNAAASTQAPPSVSSPGPTTPRSHQARPAVTPPPPLPMSSWNVRRDQTPPGRPSQLPRPASPALELPAALRQAAYTPRESTDRHMHTPRELQATPRGETTPREYPREAAAPREHRPASGMDGRRADSGSSSFRCPSVGAVRPASANSPPLTPRLAADAAVTCSRDPSGRLGGAASGGQRPASAIPAPSRSVTPRISAGNGARDLSRIPTESARRRSEAQSSQAPAPQSARARLCGAPTALREPLSARAGHSTTPLSARAPYPGGVSARPGRRPSWAPTSAWGAPKPVVSGTRPGRLARGCC